MTAAMTGSTLFLCTGNACRSQMADGFARRLLSPELPVFSAGTSPKGLDPRAVSVMAEVGIDISGQRSKSLADVPLGDVDRVITLCGDAAERCPTLSGARREHWPLRDPARARGSEVAMLGVFRSVRDEILSRVLMLAESLGTEPAIGIIGGSGFYDLPGVVDARRLEVETPFGAPSSTLLAGRLAGRRVVFLARHGDGHSLLPGEVNARANIYALKRLGVTKLVSISAVGSLREEIEPGQVVLPRQFIDRTTGRAGTFFAMGVVAHVSLADPVCGSMSDTLADVATASGARVHRDGTYMCIEGPQFSTRAESALWRSWGADVVGMTNLPEARVAREAELCYATLALPTDYDCWRARTEEVRVADILAVLKSNVEKARRILARALEVVDPAAPCSCHRVLATALLTPPESIDARARLRLHALLARRLRPERHSAIEVAS